MEEDVFRRLLLRIAIRAIKLLGSFETVKVGFKAPEPMSLCLCRMCLSLYAYVYVLLFMTVSITLFLCLYFNNTKNIKGGCQEF